METARFFYNRDVFTREGAAPGFLQTTLFGRGGIQGLDGAAHRHRKAMFLALLGPGRTDALTARAVAGIEALRGRPGEVVLQDAFEDVLTAAVCDLAGVPLGPDELPGRARMLSHLFEHAASVDPRHPLARLSRRRADRWAAAMVEDVRAGRLAPPP